MPGAEMLATIPEWVVPTHDEVMDLLRACGGPSPRAGYALGRERAAYWVTDIVWSSPISRRVGERPVTRTEAQTELLLAARAAAARTSLTARESQRGLEATTSPASNERGVTDGALDVLAWLLGGYLDLCKPSVWRQSHASA